MNIPSQTILTNELKLHDYKGVKLSITFGDADINDGYSYSRINFRAAEAKIDFLIDKPILNFIADGLTLNDSPVWNMAQQGPNTGMNSDMVDGLHAYDLKDRLGSHHYIHMANTSSKKFVKIATLTPRRMGTPADFRTDGKSPYTGIFSNLALRDKIGEFQANTPINLENAKNTTFQSTDMVTEGAYNSCLRGSVSILKNSTPTTIDFHIGLFSDPTETSKDGWNSLKKFFYVSTHDKNIPFINNGVAKSTSILEESLEKVNIMMEKLSEIEDIPTPIHVIPDGEVSSSTISDSHARPAIDKEGYVTPMDISKDYSPPADFPPIETEGESYDKFLEIFRLYYIGTTTENIDGISVVTHKYDLYMAIDSKTEFHITPYMSSSAFLYNFEKPITEGELPTSKFLRAKSIYDDRYAYKYHRHQDYETKITGLVGEVDSIWNQFDRYVQISQGTSNAKKVLMTDNLGYVFPTNDNFERHTDAGRNGSRVLVSTSSKCIGESEITTAELSQLQGVHNNVQSQIHDLISRLAVLKTDITTLKADVAKLKTDVTTLKADVTTLKTDVTTLKTDVTTIKTNVTDLKTDLEGQINGIVIPVVPDVSNFLKKTGDTMTGDLTITNMGRINFTKDAKKIYIFAGDNSYHFGVIAEGINVLRYNNANSCVQLGSSSIMLGLKKLSIGSTAPTGASDGDIWIKNT